MTNILIIEDQECPLEALEFAVEKVMPNVTYEVARDINTAKSRINDSQYDIVFVDHRMPYEHDAELEKNDLRSYSDTLVNYGYNLIPLIREKSPNAVIIGTSSLDKEEVREYGEPDFTMSKMWGEAINELEKIVEKI